jgi:hypothetical protein
MSLTGFNRRRRKLAKKKKARSDKKEIDYTEKVKKYHTGGGWYDLPDIEDNLRKDEAIAALKESDQ